MESQNLENFQESRDGDVQQRAQERLSNQAGEALMDRRTSEHIAESRAGGSSSLTPHLELVDSHRSSENNRPEAKHGSPPENQGPTGSSEQHIHQPHDGHHGSAGSESESHHGEVRTGTTDSQKAPAADLPQANQIPESQNKSGSNNELGTLSDNKPSGINNEPAKTNSGEQDTANGRTHNNRPSSPEAPAPEVPAPEVPAPEAPRSKEGRNGDPRTDGDRPSSPVAPHESKEPKSGNPETDDRRPSSPVATNESKEPRSGDPDRRGNPEHTAPDSEIQERTRKPESKITAPNPSPDSGGTNGTQGNGGNGEGGIVTNQPEKKIPTGDTRTRTSSNPEVRDDAQAILPPAANPDSERKGETKKPEETTGLTTPVPSSTDTSNNRTSSRHNDLEEIPPHSGQSTPGNPIPTGTFEPPKSIPHEDKGPNWSEPVGHDGTSNIPDTRERLAVLPVADDTRARVQNGGTPSAGGEEGSAPPSRPHTEILSDPLPKIFSAGNPSAGGEEGFAPPSRPHTEILSDPLPKILSAGNGSDNNGSLPAVMSWNRKADSDPLAPTPDLPHYLTDSLPAPQAHTSSEPDLSHNLPHLEDKSAIWLNRLMENLNENLGLQHPTEPKTLNNSPGALPENIVMVPNPEPGRARDLDRLPAVNQPADNPQTRFWLPAAHDTTPDSSQRPASTPLFARSEMPPLNQNNLQGQDPGRQQPRLEPVPAIKNQNQLNLPADARPARVNDTTTSKPTVAAQVANGAASRQEAALLSNLIIRVAEPSIDARRGVPEQARAALDPHNPLLVLARQQILADAISLRDLLNMKGSLDPTRLSGLTGIIGMKAVPEGARSLQDLILTGRGLGPDGQPKFDPLAINKGLEGKLEPGLKGTDVLNGGNGIVGGGKATPDGLLPGDRELTGDRKDITDKKDDPEKDKDNDEDKEEGIDKELAALLAAKKIKDRKPEDKEDTSKKDEKKDEQEMRRKYVVQQGDTLESIAEKFFSDRRYSLLLEIVNRGYIRYQWEGAVRKPLLRVGQIIWLPTSQEVKVHQVLFSSSKNKKLSGAARAGKDSQAAASPDDSETEEISQELPEIQLVDDGKVVTDSSSDPSAEIPARKDQAAEANAANPNSGTAGESRTVIIAPAPEAGAQRSEQSWAEIQDLLNRMRIAAATGRFPEESLSYSANTSCDLPLVGDDDMVLKQLDSRNRIVMENGDEEGAFFLRQEKQVEGKWKTIACYEFRDGRSVRYLNKSNGARRSLHLNLPQPIVREMAVKDFSKNWQNYARDYDLVSFRSFSIQAQQAC